MRNAVAVSATPDYKSSSSYKATKAFNDDEADAILQSYLLDGVYNVDWIVVQF